LTEANPFEPPKAKLEGAHQAADPDGPPPALWNPDAAGAWSLLLTPIFGSILLRKNWEAIGDPAKVRAATIWLAASIGIVIALWLYFPLGGLLYIYVWHLAWQRKQTDYVSDRWGTDYPRKGWLLPVTVGIVTQLGVGFAFVLIATYAYAPRS